MLSRLVGLSGILFLLVAAAPGPQAERVVAVGDVHGDLDRFTAILQTAGLIDGSRQWTGGKATLVQLGDLLDRGAKSRALMDFLMTLEKEAPKRGGTVRLGLGNHEVMNMVGDLAYVSPEEYAAFADNRSEQRRKTAFQSYARLEARSGRKADEEEWTSDHPLGFVEHREAFSPQGKYGKWLRGLPAVNKVHDSIFLHGGLDPAMDFKSVDQINSAVTAEIQAFDKVTGYMIQKGLALPFFTIQEFAKAALDELEKTRSARQPAPESRAHIQILSGLLQAENWLIFHVDGPLWFRAYNGWTEAEGEQLLPPLLQTLGVRRIVVAHTPQANGEIWRRFDGKVFLIDTAMLRGRPSALEISGGRIRALYLNSEKELEAN
jgi:hypothetical protein